MAKHWDGLVLEDYKAVMPLTWNRKWGINYLYQPPFTQQLGIFSSLDIDEVLVKKFLAAIPTHFRFAEIFLNYKNSLKILKQHTNLILELNKPYDFIRSNYSNDLTKNLSIANRYKLKYIKNIDPDLVLKGYQQRTGPRVPHVREKDYKRFEKLCTLLLKENALILRGVYEEEVFLCGSLFLKHDNRIYLIESITWPAARKKRANHFLLDKFIQEFSDTNLIVDFEGSDIPGIASFKKNFGSKNQPYFFYRFNRLPFLFKWIKNQNKENKFFIE
jgi:hypothetical protein